MPEQFNARKARSKRPFPLWVDALLADVQFMEADEFGAYMKILISMWRTESLSISTDPKRLARASGVSLRLWNSRISGVILPKLYETKDGLTQARIQKEAAYVERQVTLQSNRKRGVNPDKPLENNNTEATVDTTTDDPRNHPSYNLQPTLDDEEEAGSAKSTRDQDELTERERVLVAMGIDKSGMTANGRIIGSPSDVIEMKRWQSLGLTFGEVIQVVTHVSQQKRDGPAISFKYFTKAMEELAGIKAAPPLEAKPMEQSNARYSKNGTSQSGERPDPALEQIARLAGLGATPGNGGS